MVKIEFDNVAAQEADESPSFAIGGRLCNLAVIANDIGLDVPYEYPIFDFNGRKIGTITVDDKPTE